MKKKTAPTVKSLAGDIRQLREELEEVHIHAHSLFLDLADVEDCAFGTEDRVDDLDKVVAELSKMMFTDIVERPAR